MHCLPCCCPCLEPARGGCRRAKPRVSGFARGGVNAGERRAVPPGAAALVRGGALRSAACPCTGQRTASVVWSPAPCPRHHGFTHTPIPQGAFMEPNAQDNLFQRRADGHGRSVGRAAGRRTGRLRVRGSGAATASSWVGWSTRPKRVSSIASASRTATAKRLARSGPTKISISPTESCGGQRPRGRCPAGPDVCQLPGIPAVWPHSNRDISGRRRESGIACTISP
jgi:hypothetical protein